MFLSHSWTRGHAHYGELGSGRGPKEIPVVFAHLRTPLSSEQERCPQRGVRSVWWKLSAPFVPCLLLDHMGGESVPVVPPHVLSWHL